MQFELHLKRLDLIPFHTAVLSAAMPLAGAILVIKMLWPVPTYRAWSVLGAVLLLLFLAFQLYRLSRLYREVQPSSADPMVKRSVNCAARFFMNGNALFLLLAVVLFQLHIL